MSNKLTYSQVKQAIPDLNEREIKDLYNRCKALIKIDTTPDDDWLLEGVIQELRNQGIYVPAFSKIKTLPTYAAYAEKSEQLRTILERQGISSKLEKRQLAAITAKCLIEYLRSFTDVSLHTMMAHIDNIPQALERAFPGYLRANMLMFLLKKDTLH